MGSEWIVNKIKALDKTVMERAGERQQQLTKPLGSLGRLEALAIQLSGMQGCDLPSVEGVHISIFAADHGVAASGVSAFPQEVTVQMVANFSAGGAAISVLAEQLGAHLEVIDVGTVTESADLPGVIKQRAGPGTANLHHEDAMSLAQLEVAMEAGRAAVQRAVESGLQLFIGGDMGIANTTAAAAVSCSLLNMKPVDLAGPGTGLDSAGSPIKHRCWRRHWHAIRGWINRLLRYYAVLAVLRLPLLRVLISTAHSRAYLRWSMAISPQLLL